MKWIKATERLPELYEDIYAKCGYCKYMGQFREFQGEIYFNDDGEDNGVPTLMKKHFEKLFWLDESGSEPEGKEAVELLDDIDFELAHLEDFTHGEHGKRITELRKRVSNFRKIWKAEAK